MQKATVQLHNETGLHARPAAQLVKRAKRFTSSITITGKGKTVSAKSLMLVLGLALPKDAEIELAAEGEDEQQAITALTELIVGNFAE